jgi:hypothetical protein
MLFSIAQRRAGNGAIVGGDDIVEGEPMLKTLMGAAGRNHRLKRLIEVVEALERRVPRPHAGGEKQIAADSARLRAQANDSIQKMAQACVRRTDAETARAQAVMTDDGGPVPRSPDGDVT